MSLNYINGISPLSNRLALIFLFFPFFSPYPLDTDVQPTCFIFCLIALALRNFSISNKDFLIVIFIFSFGFIFSFYINTDYTFSINRRFAILSSIILIIFLIYYIPKCSYKILKKILEIHIILMIIQYFLPIFFENVFGNFLNRITYFDGDSRGVHGLNSEPGGAAAVITSIYFTYSYKAIQHKLSDKYNFYILLLTAFSFLITKSGLGIILLLLIYIHFYFVLGNKNKFLLIYPSISIILLLLFNNLFINDISNYRSFELFEKLITNFPNILFEDGSIAERLVGLSYGILSLIHFPFGVGGGGYPLAASVIENEYNISELFYSARPQINDAISMFGIYLAEFGFIFVMFFLGLLYIFFPGFNIFLVPYIIALSFIFFSFSMAFPVTWVLFSICLLFKRSVKNN